MSRWSLRSRGVSITVENLSCCRLMECACKMTTPGVLSYPSLSSRPLSLSYASPLSARLSRAYEEVVPAHLVLRAGGIAAWAARIHIPARTSPTRAVRRPPRGALSSLEPTGSSAGVEKGCPEGSFLAFISSPPSMMMSRESSQTPPLKQKALFTLLEAARAYNPSSPPGQHRERH